MTESSSQKIPDGGPRLVHSREQARRALTELEDHELLKELRQDDELALSELIRRKTPALLQVCFRVLGDQEEARDVVQMTFLRVWNHRHEFDRRYSPNTWIYRIATNLSIDHLRSRQAKERQQSSLEAHVQLRAVSTTRRELASLQGSEVQRIFLELSACLSEKQRAVFVLRELEDLSSKEVAQIVGCRESTVRNHLFQARRLLRAALLERYPEYAGHHSGRGECSGGEDSR